MYTVISLVVNEMYMCVANLTNLTAFALRITLLIPLFKISKRHSFFLEKWDHCSIVFVKYMIVNYVQKWVNNSHEGTYVQ